MLRKILLFISGKLEPKNYLLPSATLFLLFISGTLEPKVLVSSFAIATLIHLIPLYLEYMQTKQSEEDLEMFEQPIAENLCEEQAKQVDDSPSYIRPVEGTVDCESFLSSVAAYRRLITTGAGIPPQLLVQEAQDH